MSSRVVVIGGGISGLSAAWALSSSHPDLDVSVIEAASHVGGKIRRGWLSRVELPVDVGAESVLARRPEALDLFRELGLGATVVHPDTSSASLLNRGALRPLPAGTMMGIPADPETLAPVLTEAELMRARSESLRPADAEDVSIGDLVAARLGDAVVDRVVEPLLGGVYAGHARRISAAAALPAAFVAYREGTPLTEAARRAVPGAAQPAQTRPPVFAGLRSGLHHLPEQMATELSRRGVSVRTGLTVRAIERSDTGFRLVCGSAADPEEITAEGVVVALPSAPAARLLEGLAPEASRALGEVQTASMAVVTLAVPVATMPQLPGSGVLVPPVEGLNVKAATFSSQKWGWVHERATQSAAGAMAILRASLGRQGEEAVLQRDDADIVDLVVSDLRAAGIALPGPLDANVQRWGGGLPQYALGHLDRVAAVRSAVAVVPGLAVAGATYDGVGIPACIGSGRAAADQVAASQWAA